MLAIATAELACRTNVDILKLWKATGRLDFKLSRVRLTHGRQHFGAIFELVHKSWLLS